MSLTIDKIADTANGLTDSQTILVNQALRNDPLEGLRLIGIYHDAMIKKDRANIKAIARRATFKTIK